MAPKRFPEVVFVLGGPGAGKGTQCSNIVERCKGWCHISAGDCLRAERNNPDSKDGELINNIIKEGKLVPVEITVKLLKNAMDAAAAEGKFKFLIDGYPRNLDNVQGWARVIGESARVRGIFFFDCPEDVMETRLLERGKTSGRNDDNIDAIKKRFKTYLSESLPIVEMYEKKCMVFKIPANDEVEKVWEDVKKLVKKIETTKPLMRPKWLKVEKINPDSRSVNVKVRVLDAPGTKAQREGGPADVCVQVGDESASVSLLLQGVTSAPGFLTKGADIRVQNARVVMIAGHIYLLTNKWSKVAETEEGKLEMTPIEGKNISDTEYELVSK